MGGVTYDTGALVAAERNDRKMLELDSRLIAEEVVPVVPAPVLAQAWRGGARQAGLARVLRMCDIEPLSEELAKSVGILVSQSGHDGIVDVAVVEGASVEATAWSHPMRGTSAKLPKLQEVPSGSRRSSYRNSRAHHAELTLHSAHVIRPVGA